MVGCHEVSSRNLETSRRKMAASGDDKKGAKKNLRTFGMEDETEKGSRFWNNSTVELAFSIAKEWSKDRV